MATFDHTLTEADIGAILGPANGFVVSLSQTAPTTDRGDPQWSASFGRWKTGYLALRGEGDTQAIYSDRSGGWTPCGWATPEFLSSAPAFNFAVGWSSMRSGWRGLSVDASATFPSSVRLPSIPTKEISAAIRIGDIAEADRPA